MTATFKQDDISIRERLDELECLPGQVGANTQALAPVKNFSGRNFLINGNGLVNQRGAATLSGVGYAMDRWYQPLNINTSHIISGDNPQINITNSTGTQLIVRQAVELLVTGQPGQFAKGKTFTLSYWIWSSIGGFASTKISFADDVVNASQVAVLPFTVVGDKLPVKQWVKVKQTFTIDADPAGTSKCLTVTVGGYKPDNYATSDAIALTDIQLEEGTEDTPYETEDKATTLAKCQRYYYQFKTPTYMIRWAGSTAANYELFTVMIPTTMRQDPTATVLTNPSPTGFAIGTLQFFSNLRVCTLKATPTAAGAFGIANDGVYALDAEL